MDPGEVSVGSQGLAESLGAASGHHQAAWGHWVGEGLGWVSRPTQWDLSFPGGPSCHHRQDKSDVHRGPQGWLPATSG